MDIGKMLSDRIDAEAERVLFGGATTATATAPATVTLADLEAAFKKLPAPLPPPLRVMSSAHWPQEFSHMETMRFPVHPIIKWLARWLPITPHVEASFARYRDCPAMHDTERNVVYCSRAQEQIIRRHLATA